MSGYDILSGRQRLQLAGLAFLFVFGVLILLLVLLPTAALILLAALLVAGVSLAMRQASAAATLIGRAARFDAEPPPTAQPILQLELASGEVISARRVPLPHPDEHTMVLTREGYLVLDGAGRVLHRIA